ncbi:MAG TPA: LptF/LptG family permease [Acidobacteriaceae bacterium]|nr:LptF/LptG family permease [Acidobacteriaceae bacterium]
MRIFTRYILGEVVSHMLIGLALFTFVLFMRDLGSILELVVRDSASLTNAIELIVYALPEVLTYTIPMAALVGILLGLSRLAADSEITAMRACGFGVFHFVRIVAIVAVAAWILGLANSLYLAPKAATALFHLKKDIGDSQVSFEVQPRVFYEDLRNSVLYVQNVHTGRGVSVWRNVFLADISDPQTPKVTTAERATVINGGNHTLSMRLRDGQQHELIANDPTSYNISTFAETDLPIQLSDNDQGNVRVGRGDTPVLAMSNGALMELAHKPDGRWFQIELEKRYAYPTACLVLMLLGIPLGLSSKRGGKSTGFVLTILLVFIYYFFSSTGVALARQGKLPVLVGVWSANVIFAIAGLLMLYQMTRGYVRFPAMPALAQIGNFFRRKTSAGSALAAVSVRKPSNGFPLILDDYVLREFLTSFALVEVTFIMLSLVFSFFELMGDIIHNHAAPAIVLEYLLNLMPSMIYVLTPLSVLIAVLVTIGVFQRSNELTAMKAAGVSLYRMILPIFVIAAILSVALFSFDQFYLPTANRRQEALRSIIKGKPPRTFLRPDRQWIFGEHKPGVPEQIFYYEFFDSTANQFANLTVFEFQPNSFQLVRRIFAANVYWEPHLRQWIFEKGWVRTFDNGTVSSYATFDVHVFPKIEETPQYFKKEDLQSSEMTFTELARYIRDLREGGFDTLPLRVQLNKKLAYPLVTLVMAILAVPFALSMGRRGSLTGVAVAIGVAIAYWVAAGLFEAMGNVNTLPAALAAWSPDLLFALAGGYLLLRTPT